MVFSSEKCCLYEVLGLPLDCSTEEIRSAYRKLALQRHSDKLVQSGLSSAAATTYKILFSSSNNSNNKSSNKGSTSSNNIVPDLFSFFSNSVFSSFTGHKKNFYKVYGVFDNIYSTELNFARKLGLGLDAVKEAPVMRNS